MESAIVYLKLRMKKFLKFVGVLPISIGPVWKSIEGFVVVPHLCAWMKYLTELENTTRSLTSPQCNLPQMVVLPTTAIQQNQYKKYNKNLIIGFSQKCYFIILMEIRANFQIYFEKIFLQRVCLAACEDQQNNVAMTTSRLPNRQTMLEWPDFCVVLRKIEVSCKQPWKRVDLDKTYPSLCSSLLDKVPLILNCYNVSTYIDVRRVLRSIMFLFLSHCHV